MGDVVNLKLQRKRKARAEAAAKAEQNRISHGLSKAERKRLGAVAELEARRLEAHRKEGAED